MPISDDWDFDYTNKVLQHVDGVLSYGSGSGGQAAVGDYIRGATSGAIAKVIARTGTAASGTLTLTNVQGLFQSGETLEVLSTLTFDSVQNSGFKVGDTITGATSSDTIDVLAIEYNFDGDGEGTVYGRNLTGSAPYFQAAEDGQVGGTTVMSPLAAATDNSSDLTGTATTGTLAVPGTAGENDSVILHYDAGTVPIPEQAIVLDGSTGAKALVEQVYGVTSTGSIRVVDYDSTGVFTDNNDLEVDQVVPYTNQVAGQVFSVGDVVVGGTDGATGRVLYDTGTQLILADESGTWNASEDLEVGGTKIAETNGSNTTLKVAELNLPNGVREQQRPTSNGGGVAQGGIFAAGDSLNLVRKLNSLYTYAQDTFDELLQMDDDEPMDAAFKGFAYSLVFDWRLEGNTSVGSDRFLRQGALIDTAGAEVWANVRTQGAQNKITDTAFLIDTSQTFRQPQLYIEQDGAKMDSWWLEGNIDILLKVRTRSDPRYVAPATPGLGQLIPGGDPAFGGGYAVFNREYYTSTYDATEADGSAGVVNNVALGTADDQVNNYQGTHTMNWNTGSAATLVVGEEFYTAAGNSQKVGIVVSQTGGTGATGTLEYVLKSGTQFANTDSCTALVSGKTFAVNGAPTDVVAGFGYDGTDGDIRFNVVDIAATPGGGSTGFTTDMFPGELVTQAVTGATGYVVYANTTTNVLYLEVASGTFSGDNDITGSESGAVWDADTGASYPSATSFNADLNNGDGAQPYGGSVSGDCEGLGAETIQNVYQYGKFLTRQEEETLFIEGPGTSDDGTVGNLYRRMKDAYAEIKPGPPLGTYTGSMAFGQGWFLDTDYINSADIRSFSVIDDNGVTRNPPNLQSLAITNVDSGWRVAAYRAVDFGANAQVILRNEFLIGTVGTNNQAADSIVEVKAGGARSVSPLPADVPDTGVLRILSPNDTGNYIRMTYSSVDRTNNLFTLTGTIGSFLTAAGETSTDLVEGDNIHVVFIEEQATGASVSNVMQYVAPIPIFFKARLKGFKPFRATTTFSSTGGSGGVVQNPDGIVDLP